MGLENSGLQFILKCIWEESRFQLVNVQVTSISKIIEIVRASSAACRVAACLGKAALFNGILTEVYLQAHSHKTVF